MDTPDPVDFLSEQLLRRLRDEKCRIIDEQTATAILGLRTGADCRDELWTEVEAIAKEFAGRSAQQLCKVTGDNTATATLLLNGQLEKETASLICATTHALLCRHCKGEREREVRGRLWEVLEHTHVRPLVLHFTKGRKHRRVEPGDLVQECAAKLQNTRLHDYDPTRGRVWTWLERILRNHILSLHRREKHQVTAGAVSITAAEADVVSAAAAENAARRHAAEVVGEVCESLVRDGTVTARDMIIFKMKWRLSEGNRDERLKDIARAVGLSIARVHQIADEEVRNLFEKRYRQTHLE